ncbi:fumarate hydratase [Stetteria hydrogenophila]
MPGVTLNVLEEAFYELVRVTATRIPLDVYMAVRRAYEEEDEGPAKAQLGAILRDMEVACARSRPICQDTGTPYVYVELGDGFPVRSGVAEAFASALRRATREGLLRPNAVDPVRLRNSGDNTGRFTPWIHWDLVPGDELRVHYMSKGGGSEAPAVLRMAPPLSGWRELARAVTQAVAEAGPLPCPPLIVGVAVAAGADMALALAKRALLRPVGVRHEDPVVAELEEAILEHLNRLGVGPHGFGGRHTVLDVKMEYAHRHPATFAIGVVVSCWATRRGSLVVRSDGSWEITSKHLSPGECRP